MTTFLVCFGPAVLWVGSLLVPPVRPVLAVRRPRPRALFDVIWSDDHRL